MVRMSLFNEILLKREKRWLQYQQSKLLFLAERKIEIEKETRTVMKILNFIPNNHVLAEYNLLLANQEMMEERINEINQQLQTP